MNADGCELIRTDADQCRWMRMDADVSESMVAQVVRELRVLRLVRRRLGLCVDALQQRQVSMRLQRNLL
jgi:hypothetical protein